MTAAAALSAVTATAATPHRRIQRVMVCFGTRPEVIKLAPVIERLCEHPRLECLTVASAQHRELLDQMLETFAIETDVDLDLMEPGQALDGLAGSAVRRLGDAIRSYRPDALLVQGDTTTALCASLAAFYLGVPVGHVEAGLRTWDRHSPFPEEVNRRMIRELADWHFCPTEHAARNLAAEGVPAEAVFVTGNTVVDALASILRRPAQANPEALPSLSGGRRRLLVTMHRRETQGEVQRSLLRMLRRVVEDRAVEVVLPVHPNPAVRTIVEEELRDLDHVSLLPPLDYEAFVGMLRTCDLVLTDSGGLQEEAPALGIPLLVMRDTTERPEGVEAGCVRLCGTRPEIVERELCELLDSPALAARMAAAPNPYGDGRASDRIAEVLAAQLGRVPAGPPAATAPVPDAPPTAVFPPVDTPVPTNAGALQ